MQSTKSTSKSIQNQNQNQTASIGDDKLQDTTDTLEDLLKLANETRSIGVNSMNELGRQGEQLHHMHNQMDNIDNNMSLAKQTIHTLEVKWYNPFTWF